MFAAIGRPFDYEVLGRARWTSRAMVATKFREGRVFLAGDAAHLWIPMGGFGMNAGITDAISLSWRLAGVLGDWLDPRILDTYETERAPLGAKIAAQAARWGRDLRPLLRAPDAADVRRIDADAVVRASLGERIRAVNLGEFECPGFQLGYVYEGSPVICGDVGDPPATTLESYVESSWPGARVPHVWRADGSSLYDQLGPGFTLLRIGGRATGGALSAAAGGRGVPWLTLDLGEDEAGDRYDGFGLVLVRPDQHVAWRSNGEPGDAEAAEVLDRVTGRALGDRAVAEWPAEALAEGFLFGEGLRWRPSGSAAGGTEGDGHLVFSDMTGGRLMRADPVTGALTVLAEVPGQPNGLGLLPDGRLVVASMFDHRLLVERSAGDTGGLEEYADLSGLATGYLGDMVVDPAGRVYVGDTGVRVLHGERFDARLGRLLRVDGPGQVEVALEGLSFPNGMVVTPDGQVLILGLSGTGRIVQCRIRAGDGALGPLRPFAAQLPDGSGHRRHRRCVGVPPRPGRGDPLRQRGPPDRRRPHPRRPRHRLRDRSLRGGALRRRHPPPPPRRGPLRRHGRAPHAGRPLAGAAGQAAMNDPTEPGTATAP